MADPYTFATAQLVAFAATRNIEQAKAFYGDLLGLRLISEDQFAAVFDANGTPLRVVMVRELVVAPYTVLGWDVPDIRSAAQHLQSSGITPQRYEGMNQDELGIWNSPSGAKVAWFQDPDGNTLSITQRQ